MTGRRILLTSPVGPLLLEHDGAAISALRYWPGDARTPPGTRDLPAAGDGLGHRVLEQLREYFDGDRQAFELRLEPPGTAFQRAVWRALELVPYGETRTYAQLAREVGRPGAARAIGQANARNPIPIVVPCHRIVAAGGGIGGYMGERGGGEGVARKRWLLEHEAARAPGRRH